MLLCFYIIILFSQIIFFSGLFLEYQSVSGLKCNVGLSDMGVDKLQQVECQPGETKCKVYLLSIKLF